jgi:hypothetical protein
MSASIPLAFARPVNPNKPIKVVVAAPTSELSNGLKRHLKAKAEAFGEGVHPRFVSPAEREWFEYYLPFVAK